MDIGIHIAGFTWPDSPITTADVLGETARAADDGGCGVISVMDHFFQLQGILGDADEPMLEAYTTMGYLAAITSRLDLQVLVTGVTYRHPGLLAKIVSTLDVLSGGRSTLGLGAAWYEREHTGLGVPFPSVSERFERLEETIQIVLQMWSTKDGAYEGRHFHLAETLNSPQPVRRPPLMIGGWGEQKTLRLVARYGDACNIIAEPGAGPDFFRRKMNVLADHCATEGTDFEHIHKTILYRGPSPDTKEAAAAFVEEMVPFANAGAKRVFLIPLGPDPAGFVHGVVEHTVPLLADL